MMSLFLGEIANPCLIMRTIFKSMRKTETLMFTYIEAIFAVLFLGIRGFIYPFWYQAILECDNVPFGCKFGLGIVFVISMAWNTKIVGIFIKRYREIIGKPPQFLIELDEFFERIERKEDAYYKFYAVLILYAIVYPAIYYGMYRQNLFLSY